MPGCNAVNAVVIDPMDPDIVYIGSDVGVFRSIDAGATWSTFMDGHPNVAVFDLVANATTGVIFSFTHGRGAYRTPAACGAPDFGGVDSVTDANACVNDGIDVNWSPPASWGSGATSLLTPTRPWRSWQSSQLPARSWKWWF